MKKRIMCTLLVTILLLSVSTLSVSADSDIGVAIDGVTFRLDVNPVNENGRILIPIRVVAEAIGADVEWDEKTKTTTLTRAGIVAKLTVDSNVALVNGESITLDVAPKIIDSRTLLPVRFVAEVFSQTVDWDVTHKKVMISEDMSFAEGSNLTEWFLGVGAIISKANESWGADPYKLGTAPRRASNVKTWRSILSNSWGVSDREDLIEVITTMTYAGHGLSFNYDVALFKSLSASERNELLKNAQGVDAYMWPYLVELDKKWGDKSIYAWDWVRMGHLCRWGYLTGYLTAKEAYELFEPCAEMLRETFGSWDEVMDNYLDGYAYWARIDVKKTPNNFEERHKMYKDLKELEKGNPKGLLFDPKVWEEPVRGIVE